MVRRVVVTGIGMLTPVGLDTASTWDALIAGQSGIDWITGFDTTGFLAKIAGEVREFDPGVYMDRKEARRMDRFAQFAVAAALQAIAHAGLKIDGSNADEVGAIIGSGIGGIGSLSAQLKVLFEKGPQRVSPFTTTLMISDIAAGQVSILTGARGPNFCTTSACASGAHAIGEAYEIIRRGDALAMIAGGGEAAVVPIGVAAFDAMRALSRYEGEPRQACRPFDAQRDGFVIAEGGAALVLEDLEYARERGAVPLAEVAGYGCSADAVHITAPAEGGAGAAVAMRRALRKSGLQPSDVGYINAHGTSTPLNDKHETAAIKSVFGAHAYSVPISSTKSMVGHSMGAAGAMEAAVCVLTLRHGIIHPTINMEYPDPDCDLDYVPNQARRADVRVALSNSLGFGGHNVTLVFKTL